MCEPFPRLGFLICKIEEKKNPLSDDTFALPIIYLTRVFGRVKLNHIMDVKECWKYNKAVINTICLLCFLFICFFERESRSVAQAGVQ